MTINSLKIRSAIETTFSKSIRGKSRGFSSGRASDYTWAHGTGASQVNQYWDDDFGAIAGGATDSLDLAGGLADDFGDTVTFTAVKYLRIQNSGTTTIRIGGADENEWAGPFGDTATLDIPPGGEVQFVNPSATGWAVTAGTGDVLSIENLDGAVAASYRIHIAGEV